MVISILLKTAFWQTSIHIQSPGKILWRSGKDKITLKAIEKHRYGLRETVSKHLKIGYVDCILFVPCNSLRKSLCRPGQCQFCHLPQRFLQTQP